MAETNMERSTETQVPSSEIQIEEAEKQEIEQTDVERTRARVAFMPRADIYETEDNIIIMMDMPGVPKENVNITLEENILTIEGYVEPWQSRDYQLTYSEYRIGDYERRFTISEMIDRENIEATMKDGVLRLTLPKAQEARTRKIPIQAA